MGSCFKFKMCRKRAYDFNAQPYEPTPVHTGTYRASTIEMEGWDPNEALKAEQEKKTDEGQVNGDAHEEVAQETAVVSSPSNSDVTFGGNLITDDDAENEKDIKGSKKKKEKKSKKEKSKKEKSKKSKSKKKKGKGEEEEIENEMVEKEENEEKKEDEDRVETGDISNMETLPRDEKHHVMTAVETTTVMAAGGQVIKETSVTESVVVQKTDDNLDELEHKMEEMATAEFDEEADKQDESITREGDAPEIVIEETTPEIAIVESTIVAETNRRSDTSFSKGEEDGVISTEENEGEAEKEEEGTVALYPQPDEQIDVIQTIKDAVVNGDVTDTSGTLIERTTKTVQETSNFGATVTVTKVITETVEKHGDIAEKISEINDEVAKF